MKNIKNTVKPIGILAASALLICQAAQANTISPAPIVVGTPGSPVPGSSVLGLTQPALPATQFSPADSDIGVNWSVTLGAGGIYTYSYTILNPAAQQDPNGVENFAVTVDAPVLTIGAGGFVGNTLADPGDITWDFSAPGIKAGQDSVALTFTSLFPPMYGNATANDSVSPAPWSGQNIATGGTPVPTPNVPDGGMTVCLLGGAMIGLGAIRRKL